MIYQCEMRLEHFKSPWLWALLQDDLFLIAEIFCIFFFCLGCCCIFILEFNGTAKKRIGISYENLIIWKKKYVDYKRKYISIWVHLKSEAELRDDGVLAIGHDFG